MHAHRSHLPDSVDTINGLHFDKRIPKRVENYALGGTGEIETVGTSAKGDEECGYRRVRSEVFEFFFAGTGRHSSVILI